MASLTILKGNNPGELVKLDGAEEFTIGRAPECQIHMADTSVSRQHAKIIRAQNNFYIVDLGSRNKTFLNNVPAQPNQRVQLKDNDRIKVCGWMFLFRHESTPSPDKIKIEDDNPESPSTVHAAVGHMSQQQLLEAQPTERLRALLDVSMALGKTLGEESLLPQIADILFSVFKQADRCFIILRDESTEALIPEVVKTRRANADTSARFSKSILHRCLDSREALLIEDAQSGGQALSASIAEFRIRSVMCAPLLNQEGNAFGLIQLDSQDRNKIFTQDDLKLLRAVASQASVAIDNARLHELAIEVAVKREEEELARRVQRSFLPAQLPEIPDYQFYAFYQAARNVGGDYYDFISHGGNRVGVLLGDVAGKGMPAALLMAKLSAEARYCVLTCSEIADAIARLNDQLLAAGMMDRFVTLVATLLDPERSRVTLVNAGHVTPLVYRRGRRAIEQAVSKDKTGFPLGMMDELKYDCVAVDLEPGDCILLFTDGVTDSINLENEAFGMERVKAAVADAPAASVEEFAPQQIGKRIIAAVQRHAAGQYQNDDIALVCFGRLEAPSTQAADSGPVQTAAGPITQPMKRARRARDLD
jgi:serine phosphatase RsbU (regulator of sigma subunit)